MTRSLSICLLALVLAGLGAVPVPARGGGDPAVPLAALDVQPFPGTPDASPQTRIAFPALAPTQLRSISVRGSRSGTHAGRLIVMAGGRGTAFVPTHPFADSEQVSVRARLSSREAGAASGAPNATALSFTFGVAAPLPLRGAHTVPIRHDTRDSSGFTHSFHSAPSIHPPIVKASGRNPDPGAGDIFADAENSVQAGPLIFDPSGQLLYFGGLHHAAAFNVEVQNYQGQSALTYWQGYVSRGVGIGTDMIVGHNYQPIAQVNAGNGYQADLHEFQITAQGNAFITAYAPVRADLRCCGGSRNGMLLDSIIQEVNIHTGQVLWEWHAYGHLHLSESYTRPPSGRPWDFFHINSVQLLPNGRLLVSARHTWAIYEINMKTGKIPQVIGGKHSYFGFGRGANFEWQHDARMQRDGTITVFDDAAGESKSSESQSRALRLRLNFKTHQITLVHAYTNNPAVLSQSQGNVQVLSDGNTFVSFGSSPYFTEFNTAHANRLFSLHFNGPLQSYRGYIFPWWGQPDPSVTPPQIAVSPSSSGTTVYASWNGATDVSSWQVLAGQSQDPTTMTPVASSPKTYFETTIQTSSAQPYFAVNALSSSGAVLGTSAAVPR